jgi:hypothetical protein
MSDASGTIVNLTSEDAKKLAGYVTGFVGGVTNTALNLSVTTAVHFTENMWKRVIGRVFLFDPQWVASSSPDNIDTFPLVALEVIKEEVTQVNAVSKKRLILWDDGEKNKGATYRPSVVHVVADNVVNEPIVHKLECLLPSCAFKSFYNQLFMMTHTGGNFLSASLAYDASKEHNTLLVMIETIFVAVGAATALIKSALDVMALALGTDNDYNRRSLLSMSRRRSILKYKSWKSSDIKNVVITGVSISKVGTEDDYYRANIELQEMPILYVGPYEGSERAKTPNIGVSIAATAIQGLFGFFLEKVDR